VVDACTIEAVSRWVTILDLRLLALNVLRGAVVGECFGLRMRLVQVAEESILSSEF
jgi:hypothetical protein